MSLDVERCRWLNDWLTDLELPHEITAIWAEAYADDLGYHLLMSAPDQPDADNAGEVAGGVCAHMPDTPCSLDGLIVDVIAALGMRALHEAFEWVRVEGRRIAEPHPGEEMWAWLAARCRALTKEYMSTFPVTAGRQLEGTR